MLETQTARSCITSVLYISGYWARLTALNQFTPNDNIAGWDQGGDADFDVVLNVNTTYAASSSSLNLTSIPQLVPVTQTLLIRNVDCASRQNFTAHIALANGTTIRKTWVDYLHLVIPPGTANVSVRQIDLNHIADSTTVIYYGKGGLTASLPGDGGDAPAVAALSAASLKYCDGDD